MKITEYINLGLTKELLKEVEDYQFENRINSRSEAIRELIKKGLESEVE